METHTHKMILLLHYKVPNGDWLGQLLYYIHAHVYMFLLNIIVQPDLQVEYNIKLK